MKVTSTVELDCTQEDYLRTLCTNIAYWSTVSGNREDITRNKNELVKYVKELVKKAFELGLKQPHA